VYSSSINFGYNIFAPALLSFSCLIDLSIVQGNDWKVFHPPQKSSWSVNSADEAQMHLYKLRGLEKGCEAIVL
jgi:hypothetical protein